MKLTRQQSAVLDALADGEWHNVWELSTVTRIIRVAARAWELRKLGYAIENQRFRVGGSNHSSWRLVREPYQLSLTDGLQRGNGTSGKDQEETDRERQIRGIPQTDRALAVG